MDTEKGTSPWRADSSSIFDRFAYELEHGGGDRGTASAASADMQYGLALQRERLKKRGLKLTYSFAERSNFTYSCPTIRSWSDARYTNSMEWRSCRLKRRFIRGGDILLEKTENVNMYETITYAHENAVVGDELYTCPNCGGITTIAELCSGCAFCGTRFQMNELYPKVTNYFMLRDESGSKKEINSEIKKYMLGCGALAFAAFLAAYFFNPEISAIGKIVGALFSGAVFGVVVGYLMWAVVKLIRIFAEGGKAVSVLVNTAGSSGRFVKVMKRYTPEFSFECFADKVMSLLRLIIYSDKPQNLPNYSGGAVDEFFGRIVDISYKGAVALKSCKVSGNMVYVTADVYTENCFEKNDDVKAAPGIFRVKLQKRIDIPIDYNFTIKQIKCKACGASFDATGQRNCPACGCLYELGDDDWMVTELVRRK